MATNHVFTIAGSKGGVGKTTTSINLGACFAAAGHATAVVEVDLPMANLVDFVDLDIDVAEAVTLHDVLAGEASIGEAVYGIRDRLSVVPSGTDLEGYTRSDIDRLEPALQQLRWHFDIIVIDTPAGMSEAVIRPIKLADEVLLISTPRVSSVRNVRNTKEITERAGTEVGGLILSKSGTGASPGADRIAGFLGLDLLGHVPEDDAVPHSQDQGEPVVENAPNSGAAIAYRKIADGLLGTDGEVTGSDVPENDTDPIVADATAGDSLAPDSADTPVPGPVASSDGGHTARADPFTQSRSEQSGGGGEPETDPAGEPTEENVPDPSETGEEGDTGAGEGEEAAGPTTADTANTTAADEASTTGPADETGTTAADGTAGADNTGEADAVDGAAATGRTAATDGEGGPDWAEVGGAEDAESPGGEPDTDGTDAEPSDGAADDSVPDRETDDGGVTGQAGEEDPEPEAKPGTGSEPRRESPSSPGESGQTGGFERDEPEPDTSGSEADADAGTAGTGEEPPVDEERGARGARSQAEDEGDDEPGDPSLGARIRSALGL